MLVAGGDGDAAVDAEVVAGGGEVLDVAEFAEEMGGRGGHCEELTW